MTVSELLSKGRNVNYGETVVIIFDNNGGIMQGLPDEFLESVKKAHVREYYIGGVKRAANGHRWITTIFILIEERGIL